MVQALQLAHMPPDLALFVALYRNVKNAPFLREQLLAGNRDFEYAFIDASTVSQTSMLDSVQSTQKRRLSLPSMFSQLLFAP